MELAKRYISESQTCSSRSDYTLPFGLVSGKATRCKESNSNRQSSIRRARDGTSYTESPDLLDRLSRQIDNYPMHMDIRDKIGAKCSQTVMRKLGKGDGISADTTKSVDTIRLPHPSQLVKRKRSRKLTDPAMNRTQRKRPPDDQFEYHRTQCKQRLSQFDSTFPPAQTEVAEASFQIMEKTFEDEKPIQKEGECDQNNQLDEAIWGETDVWIHHRWKYKKHNQTNPPIPPYTNNQRMISFNKGDNLLQPEDWYEQFNMQTMSSFHGLKNRKQEE